MPDKWDQYAVPDQSPPDKWEKYAVSTDDSSRSTPSPLTPSQVTPDVAKDAWQAAVHANMLNVSPGYAYQNRDEMHKQLQGVDPDYDKGFGYAAETGFEDTPLGMLIHGQAPEPFESTSALHNFIHGVTDMATDPILLGGLVGSLLLGPEVGIGAFALDAGLRKGLVDHYQKGDVKSFTDLTDRAADVLWAGAKGGIEGYVMGVAGDLPVGSLIGKSAAGTIAMKGFYQSSALTVAGSVLEGRVPKLQDFESSAAVIVPLNLITGGLAMTHGEAKQATLDVYAKDGTTPQETTEKLNAQPTVKPDLPPGLRPAIEIQHGYGTGVIEADEGENHSQASERILGKKPVSMEELEADPSRADEVLQQPKIQEQSVIDRAWTLKKEEVDAGEVIVPRGTSGESEEKESVTSIDDLYNRSDMKSGRGFVTPDGKFLSREQAKAWMKENEPDVHQMWAEGVTGDKSAELHSEDYAEARNRVQGLSLAKGDPTIVNLSPENAQRLAAAREGLNKIKANLTDIGKYGREVLRTLFVGQRDTRIAATTQLRDSIKKLIPDYHDQEALSILRDYKGTPDKLATDLERIRESGSDREKALIPSIERAMNPTPELMKADGMLTDYYTGALDEGQQLGFMESSIDPSHYSPHILTRILEGEKPSGTGKATMTQNTPFAKERSYPTILDALKTGKIDARTVNALDALSVYGDRHATVVATKILATELKNTELGKYGTRDNHPDGWVEFAPGQGVFRQTIPITDPETGEPDLFSRSLYVPKDVADAMKPMFESGIKGTMLAPLLVAQRYVKTLELGLSFFHMKALSVTAFNNMGLSDFTRSLVSDTKSPEFASAEREWAADGLTTAKTSTPYEAYKGLNKSSIPIGFDKLANAPVIKQIDAAFKWTTHETFDVIQRKFKVQDASLKAASWMAKHSDATNEEYFAARRSIAKEVNAAYGGLNWDVLGTGKTVRDVSRLFLLAPDWTFSNVLNAKYSFEGGPAGSAARMFWAKSFATGFAMTAATSIAIGGKYDPTDVKHIDQVYLGTDKDGKEMYANWFFAGAPKDAMTLVKRSVSDSPIAGTAEFIVSKASPLLGMLGGLNYNKQATGAPIYKKTDDAGKQFEDQAKYVAGRTIPITVVNVAKTVADALTDPDHDYSYTDLLNLAADSLGSPTVHEGSGQRSSTTQGSVLPGAKKGSKSVLGKTRFSIRSGR